MISAWTTSIPICRLTNENEGGLVINFTPITYTQCIITIYIPHDKDSMSLKPMALDRLIATNNLFDNTNNMLSVYYIVCILRINKYGQLIN